MHTVMRVVFMEGQKWKNKPSLTQPTLNP